MLVTFGLSLFEASVSRISGRLNHLGALGAASNASGSVVYCD